MTKSREDILKELVNLYEEANNDPDEGAKQSKINGSSFKESVTGLAEELKKIDLNQADPLNGLKEAYELYLDKLYLEEDKKEDKFDVLFSALGIAIEADENRSEVGLDDLDNFSLGKSKLSIPREGLPLTEENLKGFQEELKRKKVSTVSLSSVDIASITSKKGKIKTGSVASELDEHESITSDDDTRSVASDSESTTSSDEEDEKRKREEKEENGSELSCGLDIDHLRPKGPIKVPSTSLRPENSDPFRGFASMQPDWIVRNPTETINANGSALYNKIEKVGGWEWEGRGTKKYEATEYFQDLEKLREHLSGSELANDKGIPIWYGDENDDPGRNPHHIRQEANITKVTMPDDKETFRITYIDEKKNLVDMIAPKAVLDNVMQIDQKYGEKIIKLNSELAQAKEALELAGKNGEPDGQGEALKTAEDIFTKLRDELLEVEEQAKKEKQQKIKSIIKAAEKLNENTKPSNDTESQKIADGLLKRDRFKFVEDNRLRIKETYSLFSRIGRFLGSQEESKKLDVSKIVKIVAKNSPPVIPNCMIDDAGTRIESQGISIKRHKINDPETTKPEEKSIDNMNVISFNAADFSAARTNSTSIHLQAPQINGKDTNLVFAFRIVGQEERRNRFFRGFGTHSDTRDHFWNRRYTPGEIVFEGLMRKIMVDGKEKFEKPRKLNDEEKKMVESTVVHGTYTTYNTKGNDGVVANVNHCLLVDGENMRHKEEKFIAAANKDKAVDKKADTTAIATTDTSENKKDENILRNMAKEILHPSTDTIPLSAKKLSGQKNEKDIYIASH